MDFEEKIGATFPKSSNKKSGKVLKETVINAWPCLAMNMWTFFTAIIRFEDDCVSHALRMPSFNDVKKNPPLRLGGVKIAMF